MALTKKKSDKEEKQLFQVIKDFLSKQEGQVYQFENGPLFDEYFQGSDSEIKQKVIGLKLNEDKTIYITGKTIFNTDPNKQLEESEPYSLPVVSTKLHQGFRNEGLYLGFGTGPESITLVYNLLKEEKAFKDFLNLKSGRTKVSNMKQKFPQKINKGITW